MAYRDPAGTDPQMWKGAALAWQPLAGAIACLLFAMAIFLAANERAVPVFWNLATLSTLLLLRGAHQARYLTVSESGRAVTVRMRHRFAHSELRVEVPRDAVLVLEWYPDPTPLGWLPSLSGVRSTRCVCESALGVEPMTDFADGAAATQIGQELARRLDLAAPITRRVQGPAAPKWVQAISFLVPAITLAACVEFALQEAGRGSTGELEVICTERCLFDGVECLPGGRLIARYEAGTRTVTIEDAQAEGGMRSVPVPILVGHRTVFECRADASPPTPVPEVR